MLRARMKEVTMCGRVRMRAGVRRAATGVIGEVLEPTHGCDGAHEATRRFVGMGPVEVMWQVSRACMLMEPTLVILERHGPWAKGCV